MSGVSRKLVAIHSLDLVPLSTNIFMCLPQDKGFFSDAKLTRLFHP